jgi:hypothetical protein
MSKETLKNKLNKVITLAKEHMVVTVVTCSVVAGGAVVGGVVAYNHAHADNEQATKIKITSAKDSSYVELKVRYLAVKGVIGELILDDVMNAKLPADAEEIRAYIENSNTKSVEKEMLEKMDELEANVEKETKNSVTKLETKEKEVADLVATINAPKFVEMEEETSETTQDESKAVILDDATLVTLDDLKKEYFSLKKANKYKSAYNKCWEIIDLIKNYGAEEESTEEKTTEETTEAETSEEETTANGNSNSNAEVPTGTIATTDNGSGNQSVAQKPQTQAPAEQPTQPQTQPAQEPQTQAPAEQPTQPQPAQEPQTQAPTQAPAEQPTENKAGVAETFYDGSVANGITAEEKAYIDGLVQNWLNGGCTNAELEDEACNYLFNRGYTITSSSSVKNTRQWLPNGEVRTLESQALNRLYYYEKFYTDGEVSGDGRIFYRTTLSIS